MKEEGLLKMERRASCPVRPSHLPPFLDKAYQKQVIYTGQDRFERVCVAFCECHYECVLMSLSLAIFCARTSRSCLLLYI